MASLKMLEVCRVTPFTNSSTPLVDFFLPLTYFDMLLLKLIPVERVFFYQLGQHESTNDFFNSVILPKLKHSLSLTLTHFLPIVGNIIWHVDAMKPYILYTPNDGVSLVVVESNSDFNYLSQNETQEAAALHPYVPELPTSDLKATIITFQITFFLSQGFSIGMSMNHAVFDCKSVAIFMKSWAHICKENFDMTTSLPLERTPSFDRTFVDEPQGLGMFFLNNTLSSSDPNLKGLKLPRVTRDVGNLVRANFKISQQDITNLRRKIVCQLNHEKKDPKDLHLSTFVVLYAYIIVSMVKAKQLERKGKVVIAFQADCRTRLNPPLPMNYFGNCIFQSFTLMGTEIILEKNGIMSIVYELSRMVKELEIRVKNMSSEREIENILKLEKIKKVADLNIRVGGSPKFGIYGTDFGWGNPKITQLVTLDMLAGEVISMAESREGNGGIEVGFVTKNNEMDMFSSLLFNGLKELRQEIM